MPSSRDADTEKSEKGTEPATEFRCRDAPPLIAEPRMEPPMRLPRRDARSEKGLAAPSPVRAESTGLSRPLPLSPTGAASAMTTLLRRLPPNEVIEIGRWRPTPFPPLPVMSNIACDVCVDESSVLL